MNEIKLSRKKLYELVWSEPLTVLAKKFGSSDNILRATCKKYYIPLPKSGHWMKIQFGKPVIIEELDEVYSGPDEILLNERDTEEINISAAASPLALLKKEIENDKFVSLKVPDKLINPDKLIVDTKNALSEREGYKSTGDRIKTWNELKILVTRKLVGRALRFMDIFIKAIKARGHEIEVSNQETRIVIYNEKIKISCREKAKRINIPGKYYNSSELQPTGILTFNIEGIYPKEWKDGKLMLEDQLSSILAKIELEGKRKQQETEYYRIKNDESRIQRQILEDRQRYKEQELEKFIALIQDARKFKEVLILREYIKAMEDKAKNEESDNDELKNWIQWAQNKTDWYDPLINQPDPDLEDVDKDTLTFKKRTYF